ncbi:glycosyltransferase [Pantoea sp. Cy-640]|uniref:glycosyltransferase n=1 Tax=Pantoea sp. Cy-640 TaxID=2608353 RepID=UPI00141A5061|nr:glycosyltransferase [Pantoea sp. Cy-640]NIG14634.1 glycosyltransferase family 4 protein [Pantoea sp. Cy-640]
MIYYDITDIINHSKFSTKVSGIQRVVLEGLRGLEGDYSIFFISPITGKTYIVNGLKNAPLNDLTPFINLWIYADIYISRSYGNIDKYFEKIRTLGRKKKVVSDTYFILSRIPSVKKISHKAVIHYLKNRISLYPGLEISEIDQFSPNATIALFGGVWNFQDKYHALMESKWHSLRKIFMVYDMIPIVSPYVPDELKNMFKKYIPFVLEYADKIIVNSNSCKVDLLEYCHKRGADSPEIDIIHLSHKLPEDVKRKNLLDEQEYPLRVRKLKNETYAFCVGSIESRKNHVNLILTWIKFFNSPEYANQKLVIAGKWLWDTEELAKQLTYSGHVYGSVIVLHDASDAEIAELYKNCRFTAYPSHYEGWGLPLGESLASGKPCLHFDTSSLKEAGYGMTIAVDYPDYKKYYEEFSRLMVDDDYYQKKIDIIENNKSKLRSWKDFSSDIKDLFYREEKIQ